MAPAQTSSAAAGQGSQEVMPYRLGIRAGAGDNSGICNIFKYWSGHWGPSIGKQDAIRAKTARAAAISVFQRF